MAVNLERFKDDLKQLIKLGRDLEYAMIIDLIGRDEFRRQNMPDVPEKKAKAILDTFPNFRLKCDEWYSEAVGLIKQLLPDRLDNFRSFYEKPRGRKSLDNENYVIRDFMQGISVTLPTGEIKVSPSAALSQYQQQLAILRAAERRFDSSLFEIRQLVQADLFDTEIDAARELLKTNSSAPLERWRELFSKDTSSKYAMTTM